MFSRKVWDALSGDEVLTLAHKHIVKTVSFTQVRASSSVNACDHGTCPTALWLSSQDSGCLLTGGNDKLLRIYDLSNTDAGDPAVPSAGLWGWSSCCLISVLCSSSGDRRSYVGDQKSSVVQQRQANPLCC